MPSEKLREKWGTIFMGDRESTVEQLDAMQEPVLRERQQKDQQQEYLERVRKRATERAREILGEAYAERQKILAEAQAQIDQQIAERLKKVEALKSEVESERKAAEVETSYAKQLREEAEALKAKGYEEGYQSGMEKAENELHEFRADVGNELAQIMRMIESQFGSLVEFWRDDLCELVRVAVQSGTSFILDTQHEAVLNSLVLQAVNLLEQREIISFRVNPEDEGLVNDMFKAARERAPEIKQWVVTGDEMIDRGGLIAESGSGSVDLRRKNFQDLVDHLLEHLALPPQEEEKKTAEKIHNEVLASVSRFTEQIEPEQPEPLPENELTSPRDVLFGKTMSKDSEPEPEPQAVQEIEENTGENTEESSEGVVQPEVNDSEENASETDASEINASEENASDIDNDMLKLPDEVFEIEEENNSVPAQDISPQYYAKQPQSPTPKEATLADLEEELFPVTQDEEHAVLQNGGFLPDPSHS